jgi:menaquinone-specific isochorismate synthase
MTFLGTSPELLYARKGAEIFSEALAATRSRSLDPSEDERLANQLFHSPKERAEHECVAQAIASYFASLCSSYERDREPSVLKLGRLQHLRTAFSGTLRDGTDDAQILSTLHPTPAVCGTPRDAAYARILACEPFTRGLYAGPLGVLSASKAEFCVAIRSMCIDGRLLNLYAGAGIVPGSDAEKEWWELDAKIEEITRLVS